MSRRRKPKRPQLAAPLTIDRVLEVSGPHLASPFPPPIDLRVWAKLTGPAIARRSEPRTLRDGVLTVQVETSTWAQELSFLQDSLLAKLKQAGYPVRALRFRIGPMPGMPSAPVLPPKVRRGPVPAALRSELERVDDPELRAILEQTGSYLNGRT